MRCAITCRILMIGTILFLQRTGDRACAQSFGLPGLHKKVTLDRKLPSISHMEGTTFKIVVVGTGQQAEVVKDLKMSLESLLIHNDPQLQVSEAHPNTTITCRIMSYDEPPPQDTQQMTVTAGGKKGASAQTVTLQRVSGILTLNFQAKGMKSGRSLAADIITAKFNQEYSASGAEKGFMHSVSSKVTHITKGASDDDTPPTPVELRERLIQDAALQAVSHFVTTTEHVEVLIAHGKALDGAANMEVANLWAKAAETLTKIPPFAKPEDDAYRVYDLGLANEALGYESSDVDAGLKYLEAAAEYYDKAIDAKPLEKNFVLPAARIQTAIAHYKLLNAPPLVESSTPKQVTKKR